MTGETRPGQPLQKDGEDAVRGRKLDAGEVPFICRLGLCSGIYHVVKQVLLPSLGKTRVTCMLIL